MSQRRGWGEHSIYKRGDGTWVASIELGVNTDGKRRRVYRTSKNKSKALAKLKAAELEYSQSGVISDPRLTVAQFTTIYFEQIIPGNVKESVASGYFNVMKYYVLPHLGHRVLSKLGPADVIQMMRALEHGGYSPYTVRRARSQLRAVLTKAERYGYVTRNVASLVDAPRIIRKQVDDTLSPEDIRLLLASLEHDRLVALADLAIHLGCRKGELLAMKWETVDFDKRQFRIVGTLKYLPGRGSYVDVPKTSAGERFVPLTPRMVEVLRVQRTRQARERLAAGTAWTDEGFVFTTTVGTPVDPRNTLRWWYEALDAAGLARRSFHSTRRTAITHMAEAGVPLEVAAAIVGHSSITVTADIYNRVRPKVQADALALVEAHLAR